KTGDGKAEQDFVLVNHPVFFVDDLAEYTRFMEIVHSKSSALVITLRLIFFFVPWRLRKGLILLRMRFSHVRNPLNTTYHSMSAYAFGPQKVVRYVVAPVGDGPDGDGPMTPNFLREHLAERLEPRDIPVSNFPTVLDFSVQIRHEPEPYDVEHV